MGAPESDASLTLCGALERQAMLRGEAVALEFEARQWTYAELALQSRRFAGALRESGVRPGDRVAWLGGGHAAQLVLLFALARLGAALLPLNFRLAEAEWDQQLDACEPVRLFHDDGWADAARSLAMRHGLVAAGASSVLDAPGPDAPDLGQPGQPALLVFTSGTTGRPKAAVHTQANLLANMRIAAQVQGLSPADSVLTVLPLFHVGGLCIQTLPALFAGARVLLHPRFHPGETLAAIAAQRPSLTLQVPATMKALIEHPAWPGTDLASLRAVWAGSSLLPMPLVDAFHARGVPVCNVYGATETGPFSIALSPGEAMSHAGSCGWPSPEVEVQLANIDARGIGEIWLRAPNAVRHYWPEQPACDGQGWFHTGDLAQRAQDGSYAIVGRSRDLIISGGENIHPAEIEAALALHPGVAECAAFGLPDPQWGESVAVAVVRAAGSAVSESDLRAHLEGRLARYKHPRHWRWVASLPRTALGKVQRHLLAQVPPT